MKDLRKKILCVFIVAILIVTSGGNGVIADAVSKTPNTSKTIRLKDVGFEKIKYVKLNNERGDATLVKVNGKNIVIDFGEEGSSATLGKTLRSEIFSNKKGNIKYFFITHAHVDHYNGLKQLEQSMKNKETLVIENLIVNNLDYSKTLDNYLRNMQKNGKIEIKKIYYVNKLNNDTKKTSYNIKGSFIHSIKSFDLDKSYSVTVYPSLGNYTKLQDLRYELGMNVDDFTEKLLVEMKNNNEKWNTEDSVEDGIKTLMYNEKTKTVVIGKKVYDALVNIAMETVKENSTTNKNFAKKFENKIKNSLQKNENIITDSRIENNRSMLVTITKKDKNAIKEKHIFPGDIQGLAIQGINNNGKYKKALTRSTEEKNVKIFFKVSHHGGRSTVSFNPNDEKFEFVGRIYYDEQNLISSMKPNFVYGSFWKINQSSKSTESEKLQNKNYNLYKNFLENSMGGSGYSMVYSTK